MACYGIEISSKDRVDQGPSKGETREQRANILIKTLARIKFTDMGVARREKSQAKSS